MSLSPHESKSRTPSGGRCSRSAGRAMACMHALFPSWTFPTPWPPASSSRHGSSPPTNPMRPHNVARGNCATISPPCACSTGLRRPTVASRITSRIPRRMGIKAFTTRVARGGGGPSGHSRCRSAQRRCIALRSMELRHTGRTSATTLMARLQRPTFHSIELRRRTSSQSKNGVTTKPVGKGGSRPTPPSSRPLPNSKSPISKMRFEGNASANGTRLSHHTWRRCRERRRT
mmetsp:Transcript_41042/g.74001  ORF Transcript_41042/g.74001 Transcript_41042/m.74001 type:complete len:231 (+) Transcript_41042:1791-2483(+)